MKTTKRKKKAVKNPASSWRKYKTVPSKQITPAPEIIVDASPDVDALADEVEALESDPNSEPEEDEEGN